MVQGGKSSLTSGAANRLQTSFSRARRLFLVLNPQTLIRPGKGVISNLHFPKAIQQENMSCNNTLQVVCSLIRADPLLENINRDSHSAGFGWSSVAPEEQGLTLLPICSPSNQPKSWLSACTPQLSTVSPAGAEPSGLQQGQVQVNQT